MPIEIEYFKGKADSQETLKQKNEYIDKLQGLMNILTTSQQTNKPASLNRSINVNESYTSTKNLILNFVSFVFRINEEVIVFFIQTIA